MLNPRRDLLRRINFGGDCVILPPEIELTKEDDWCRQEQDLESINDVRLHLRIESLQMLQKGKAY